MRLLICAGGTGGGVYPALAVLEALSKDANPVLWVGSQGGMEADLVQRAGITYTEIPAAGVHGVGMRALPGNLLRLIRGTLAARQILRTFKPDVLLFTGGYIAAPMAVAGSRIPSMLFVPDIEPGLAIKFLALFAHCIAVPANESRKYLSRRKHVELTGYPVRSDLSRWERDAAMAKLDMEPDLPILLVLGGSKGARSINQATLTILTMLLQNWQIIHITGKLDWEEVNARRMSLPVPIQKRYHTYPYLYEEMGAALRCADIVLSRAGASCLGEYPLFGLPAILVPYPYAWRYQKVNADYLVKHQAAVLLEDNQLTTALYPTIETLAQDKSKLSNMRQAMRSLSQPQAANNLANLIRQLASQKGVASC